MKNLTINRSLLCVPDEFGLQSLVKIWGEYRKAKMSGMGYMKNIKTFEEYTEILMYSPESKLMSGLRTLVQYQL